MPYELFANNATTSLNGSISSATSNTTGSITVSSNTGFPTASATTGTQFRVLIEAELLIVTANPSTTWTVTRGVEGTTAPSHPSGAAVNLSLTNGALSAFAQIAQVAIKTSSYTMATTDGIIIANAAALTITLPSAVTAGAGRQYTVKNGGSGTSTVVASSSGTIDGVTTYTGLTVAYATANFISDGTNWFII